MLVDNGTAGPGEIVAAAVLDAGRGELVGEHTFGRAAVQRSIPLSDGGLVLTVARYASPKGTVIHGKGLEPSVAVAETREDGDETKASAEAGRDRYLEKALELLKADAARKAA